MDETPVTAFVLAGGEGRRLRPLTETQPKPALPFADGCRIIDFVLSNLLNSGIRSVFVLLQYKPQVLVDHLAANWRSEDGGVSIEPVLPAARAFDGTADAVHQSLDVLNLCEPEAVAVFAADHVYRMDARQMLAFHRASDADATVAALPVPIEDAREFGVMRVDGESRITEFQEKPLHPAPMPDDPDRAFVSMGNYLFRPAVLRQALREASLRGEHDFGRHVLPRLIGTHRVMAYDFKRNVVPGLKPHEQPCYWRDVGTLVSYAAARADVAGTQPLLCLDNPAWPIGARNLRNGREATTARKAPPRRSRGSVRDLAG
jgi:glucose-1-phosphate adenylyltransferase